MLVHLRPFSPIPRSILQARLPRRSRRRVLRDFMLASHFPRSLASHSWVACLGSHCARLPATPFKKRSNPTRLYCAHRTSTVLSCAFCEQEGWSGYSFSITPSLTRKTSGDYSQKFSK